ncbi:MAG: hypothetical protein JNK46_12025 [Methylobacteriaceae bacterium]|nr:hypothetical protein [Methylobacteriaceae bacterium]
MPHLLLFLALLLIGAGGGALYMAVDLAGIERGTMYAVSGAVAVSAGVVTLALARILAALESLARDAAARRAAQAAPPAAAGEPRAAAWPPAAAPTDNQAAANAPPRLAIPAIDPAKIEAETRAADPPAADAANGATSATTKAPTPGPTAATRPDGGTRSGPESGPAKPLAAATGPAAAPLSAASLARDVKEETLDWLDKSLASVGEGDGQPRVVGRYQASGVDYVMYSDGSIEADNGGARRRFASLAELKAFIGAA